MDIARNGKAGVKYSADRYVRFTEEKLKSKEALIEKLRLKNAKMSDRNRKISHQLKVFSPLDIQCGANPNTNGV